MMRRFSRLAPSLAVVLPVLLVTSCDSQSTEATGDTIPAGQAQLLLAANVSATSISTLVVEVTASFGSFGVVVDPSSATLAIAETVQLTATVLDANGHPTGDVVTWATSNPGVASVDANGLVTANVEGSAEIVATFNGVGGSVLLTVGGAGSPSGALGIDGAKESTCPTQGWAENMKRSNEGVE